MSLRDFVRPDRDARERHLWPHGAHVLDLGTDLQAAEHLRDLHAHDFGLRGVLLDDLEGGRVIAYYDANHQSGLTQRQRGMVRAWVRRHERV